MSVRRRLACACFLLFLCGLEVESFGKSIPSAAFLGSRKKSELVFQRLHATSSSGSGHEDSRRKNEIVVSSEVDLPFPATTAFHAFSDMSRQTSWSPWLQSVEYTDEYQNTTLWKMKYLGVSTSWVSVCTYEDPPRTICWKSIQGLPNRGRVDFIPESGKSPTRMKMTMTFQVPRLIARMFSSSSKVSRMVENRMILPTLESFRQDVLRNDRPWTVHDKTSHAAVEEPISERIRQL